VANGWLKNKLIVGSQIIVTEMEHHSNLVPWQLVAQSTGAELFYWKKNKEGRLDLEDLNKLINVSVKLIAITAVSNVLGTINLIKKIIEIAHLNNIPVLVDAAQALARIPVNVKEWDCDFLAFSGHKVYGPNGIGVLYSKKERIDEMIPIKGGGGMISYVEQQKSNWARAPQKFEAGTPAVAEVYSLTKALEFIELYGISQIQKHEQELTSYVLKRFSEMEDLILYGPKDTLDRVGIISFNFCNLHAHDVAQVLDEYGIAVRAGHHCTHILHKTLGIVASVRISFGIYNQKSEIDRLLDALKKTKEIFFITRKK